MACACSRKDWSLGGACQQSLLGPSLGAARVTQPGACRRGRSEPCTAGEADSASRQARRRRAERTSGLYNRSSGCAALGAWQGGRRVQEVWLKAPPRCLTAALGSRSGVGRARGRQASSMEHGGREGGDECVCVCVCVCVCACVWLCGWMSGCGGAVDNAGGAQRPCCEPGGAGD